MAKHITLSIITPTIGRSTLGDTVRSVESQKYRYVEHIIIYDGLVVDPEFKAIYTKYHNTNVRRRVIATNKKFGDFGHTPRSIAWEYATGDYLSYMDDDDVYIGDAFNEIVNAIEEQGRPTFVVYPILRFGARFFSIPAGAGRTTSNQYFHRKFDSGGAPIRFSGGGYNHDGEWIQSMVALHDFYYLNSVELAAVDRVSRGEML